MIDSRKGGWFKAAIAQTQQALALYDVLGDSDQVAALEERLDFLEN
ncbi:hypothetical protein [Halomicronema sp. CCY15110]|nr:hypothetical protein [Halomicronema sp. CCY15110]